VTGAARILIVDDEPSIVKAMAPLLRSRGYEVEAAATGRAALDAFERDPPNLVILDLMLPDLDGLEVCRQLRQRGDTPIIVLSAREAERDKVAALDLGADDYVTKPFGPDELLARVRVALRRSAGEPEPAGQLTRGDLVVDFDKRRVLRNGDEIRLTPKEFELLVYLARHAGRVLTHKALLREIWGPHFVDQPEHLRVLVNAVRKKVEPDPANPRYILTEPWVGYRFAE
jgi:two-component system, OmpR family, KDP operon response regulator KdpE